MTQRLDKRIFERITEAYADNPTMTENEVFDLIDQYVPKPDPVVLHKQWLKRTATSIIARMRDEKNVRKIFATRDETGNTVYENVEKSSHRNKLKDISHRLNKKYKGIEKSLRKVKNREKKVMKDQMVLVFDEAAATSTES